MMIITIIIITWLHYSTSTFQGQRFNFRWTENAIRWNNFVAFHLRTPIASIQNYPVSSSKRAYILSNLITRLILTNRSRPTLLNTTISAHFNLLSSLLVKIEVSIPWGTVQSNNNLTITQLLPRRWVLSEALTAVQLLNIQLPYGLASLIPRSQQPANGPYSEPAPSQVRLVFTSWESRATSKKFEKHLEISRRKLTLRPKASCNRGVSSWGGVNIIWQLGVRPAARYPRRLALTCNTTEFHIYRFEYQNTDNHAHFYENGNQLGFTQT